MKIFLGLLGAFIGIFEGLSRPMFEVPDQAESASCSSHASPQTEQELLQVIQNPDPEYPGNRWKALKKFCPNLFYAPDHQAITNPQARQLLADIAFGKEIPDTTKPYRWADQKWALCWFKTDPSYEERINQTYAQILDNPSNPERVAIACDLIKPGAFYPSNEAQEQKALCFLDENFDHYDREQKAKIALIVIDSKALSTVPAFQEKIEAFLEEELAHNSELPTKRKIALALANSPHPQRREKMLKFFAEEAEACRKSLSYTSDTEKLAQYAQMAQHLIHSPQVDQQEKGSLFHAYITQACFQEKRPDFY